MGRLPQHLLLEAWSDFLSGEELAESTIIQYRYWLIRLNADRLVDLHDVVIEDITAFLARLPGPSKAEAKRALKRFYRWMVGTNRMEDDPTLLLGPYRLRRRAPEHLSWDELTRLVYAAACHSAEWAWSLLFIFATGARISEACAVRLADVDLEQGKVVFRDTKNGSDRELHLGPTGIQAAAELVNGRPTLLGVSPSAVRRRMKILGLRTRIAEKKLHPHVLRHSCGTLLAEEMWKRYGTVDRQAIMDRLGHKDPTMTDHYVAISSPRAVATATLLER